MSSSVYDFSATLNNGEQQSLADYQGKVLLVVNTASKCGFTPQYEGLEALYRRYHNQGFEVLGFPCDQFGHQEPGSDEDIKQFCEMNFGVSFPLFEKTEVNGDKAHPLYVHLKSKAPGVMGTKRIKWNFTKFLIDQRGNVVKRYAPATKPSIIEGEVRHLLKNGH